MKIKIAAINKKQMPSKWGGTWTIVKIKLVGSDDVYELQGFDNKKKENLKTGDELECYLSERVWQGKEGRVITKTVNKISSEYVYNLLVSKFPEIENNQVSERPIPKDEWSNSINIDTNEPQNEWNETNKEIPINDSEPF